MFVDEKKKKKKKVYNFLGYYWSIIDTNKCHKELNSLKQRRHKVILFCARNLINFLAYRTKYINYICNQLCYEPWHAVHACVIHALVSRIVKSKREREKRGIPFEDIQTRVICVAKCVGGVRHARCKELRSTCALMNHDSPLIMSVSITKLIRRGK